MDIKTIFIVSTLIYFLLTILIISLWRQNKNRNKGIGFWVIHFILLTIAQVLIAMRGVIPDILSIVLANALVILGVIFLYAGLNQFIGKTYKQIHNYIFLAIFTGVHYYFTFIIPDLWIRNINSSIGMIFVFVQCAWLMLHRTNFNTRHITKSVGIVYIVYTIINIFRIVELFNNHSQSNNFFESNNLETTFLLLLIIMVIWLAYDLNLMVNERLLMEVKSEGEKFSVAFFTSPYVMTITRAADGKIVNVNDTFTKVTGYTHDEVVGKNTIELGLWSRNEDRVQVVNSLLKGEPVKNMEFIFNIKSGGTITGLFSANMIKIENEPLILSSIDDITKLKHEEKELKKHIDEIESINKTMVGRELKMIELKKEIDQLRSKK